MAFATEIHELLGLGEPEPKEFGTEDTHAPAHLPVAAHNDHPETHAAPISPEIAHATDLHGTHMESLELPVQKKSRWKALVVYPLVFVLAFGFFYSVLNFQALTAVVQGWFTKPQQQQQLGSASAAYQSWIESYYFGVSNASLLDPNNDNDGDGLSNQDEFTLGTNPTLADTDADSYPDGLEVLTGHNPIGPGALTAAQSQVVANIDLNLVSNRISYNASVALASKQGLVSGASTVNIDLTKPGTLSIPRLNMQVPLIWSKDPSNFEADLEQGVIHYPGTALPGQNGIIYVSGHSSDYIWKKDPFAQVFTKLNYLKPGDDIFVMVYGLDGKQYNYRYQVSGNRIYKPDDQAQFIGVNSQVLNLSTCWPIGTSADRLVVSAIPVPL